MQLPGSVQAQAAALVIFDVFTKLFGKSLPKTHRLHGQRQFGFVTELLAHAAAAAAAGFTEKRPFVGKANLESLLAQAQGDEASGDTPSDHQDIAIDGLQVTHLSTPSVPQTALPPLSSSTPGPL